MEFPESFELTNAGLQISLRCLDASTIRRSIAERLYNLSHDDLIDEDGSSENVGSNESSGTEYNGTSTIVNDDNDSDQDESCGSHEDGVSYALLDCELEVGLTKYAIAIQLQHTQAGDRYGASAAVGENLFKHGHYPHRLLFVKAEAVEGAKCRAMLIRHDYTAWYLF
ncbi:hypothetical protein BU23DRAFT_572965 [Bimuria novae-zelandiae CBS 107.79]|uniref:Uncharacterized protein n=1 Tax=Bimuria novae-zelandiae CBS 107.79 TaxID=1447943 RepID=A0A6A5USH7_9PLEO|nr:hypothetical protein BU23DRAFT_572965 [Bimuria novae-zelandiae CBS 107.79]